MIDRLHSDAMPTIPFHVGVKEMGDLFSNFALNWYTLSPILIILFGILISFTYLSRFKDELDDEKNLFKGILRSVRRSEIMKNFKR